MAGGGIMRANLRSFSKGGSVAKIDSSTAAFVKEYQERFEKKIRENEIEVLEHWREQLEKVMASRPDSIASLLTQMRKVSEMMSNRIKVLKKG
mgnify:CR=1 FL=1